MAVAKQDDLHTGSILGDVELPPIPFPKPMVGLALAPKSRGDENKLAAALHKLVEEDATLRLDRDSQTSELVITGMSEFHLKMILERLHLRDKLDVETKDPKIRSAKRSKLKRKACIVIASRAVAAVSSAKCTSACSRYHRAPTSMLLRARSGFQI